MPSRQPRAAIDEAERRLLRLYVTAWRDIENTLAGLVADPSQARKQARMASLRRSVEREMAALDRAAKRWLRDEFPDVYQLGGVAGATEAGGTFTWSQFHRDAVRELADDLHSDLLRATQNVRETTKRLVRRLGRDATLRSLLEGETPTQAAKRMEYLLQRYGIYALRYADGSVHGLDEYTQMAVRTKTAQAYNTGTIRGADAQFFEVFDGPFCGWTFHEDRPALGMVVTANEAMSYPVSHPNCRRAFGARPDIVSQDQARAVQKASGSVSSEQRRAQIRADVARDERISRRDTARRRARRIAA